MFVIVPGCLFFCKVSKDSKAHTLSGPCAPTLQPLPSLVPQPSSRLVRAGAFRLQLRDKPDVHGFTGDQAGHEHKTSLSERIQACIV